ncbi:MAG: BatD family protein [Planctomycetota bacterium]|nr:BatD family protein [Planctomycetota bacterium]
MQLRWAIRFTITATLGATAAVPLAGCRGQDETAESPTSKPAGEPVSHTVQDGPVKLTVSVDRDAVAGTDPVTLTLVIEAERGVQVSIPQYEEILGDFIITGATQGQPIEGTMTARVEHQYNLEGVLPGDCEIPPIAIEYIDDRERSDGSQETLSGTVSSKPIHVKVDIALAGMKEPATLPMSFPKKVVAWALGIIATMAAIGLFARWWRRRQPSVDAPSARRLIAHEWALAELAELVARNLPGQGRAQEFYYRINGLIRRYIELRFGLMAAEQTSEEFIRALGRSPLLSDSHKGGLQEFTNACDPVKYAGLQPDQNDITWVQVSAENFIRETAATTYAGAEPAHVSSAVGTTAGATA